MVDLEIKMNQAGQRLDKFLGKYLPQAPVSFIYKMLRKKNITLNGKKAEGKEILRLEDQVTLWLADETILKFGGYLPGQGQTKGQDQADELHPPTESSALNPSKNASGQSDFSPSYQESNSHVGHSGKEEALYHQAYKRLQGVTVLYEDVHVLILDKPAGVLTQQAEEGDLSLNEWMIGYLLDTEAISPQELRLFKPSVCNRLDRNTSGLVLCGKSLPGSQALSGLIRSRAVRKFYRTICVGLLEMADSGAATEIRGYLQKNPHTNRVMISQQEPGHQKKAGEYIRTTYRPMKRYCIPTKALGEKKAGTGISPEPGTCFLTELEVELITGKSHQIRAHLASIGHPLVGDCKYGNASVNQLFRQRFGLRWQLLHAYRLQFPALEGVLAPLSGRCIQAPLPARFDAVMRGMNALENSGNP